MRNVDLLTARQVAAAFKVTPTTVVRWARAGQLPGVQLPSGRWRFRADDVDAYLQRDRVVEDHP